MVSLISGNSVISKSTLFVRDILRANISDPLSRSGSGTAFVYSSYPRENIIYPIITVVDNGIRDIRRMGMQSESTLMQLPFEVRVWARNVVERDSLSDNVYSFFKNNQFGTGSVSVNVGLHDFTCTSMTNVDEAGEEGIKSKVMGYKWIYINE